MLSHRTWDALRILRSTSVKLVAKCPTAEIIITTLVVRSSEGTCYIIESSRTHMAVTHDCSSVFFDVTARVWACVYLWIIVVRVKGVTTVQVMPVTKIDGDRIKRLVD